MKMENEKREEMFSLLFLTVNSSYSHSSLALPLLHSAAKDLDHVWKWDAMEKVVDEDPMLTASVIAESSPDLLCTTLYLFNHNIVIKHIYPIIG